MAVSTPVSNSPIWQPSWGASISRPELTLLLELGRRLGGRPLRAPADPEVQSRTRPHVLLEGAYRDPISRVALHGPILACTPDNPRRLPQGTPTGCARSGAARRRSLRHSHAHPDAYDVLYSVFGAVDFTDPRTLLPAAAEALRPFGCLGFFTLAHYLTGAPAQPDVSPADVPAKTSDGENTTMRCWVLQEHIWTKALDEAGFTSIHVEEVPAGKGLRPAATLIVTAQRRTV